MSVLVDTNVLLRSSQPQHPLHSVAKKAIEFLRRREDVLYIAAQNLFEFWAVCTRPSGENGLGLTPTDAMTELRAVKSLFTLLPEVPLLNEWERIVTRYNVLGRNTHDARLAAAMSVHRIENLLTFDVEDFKRYSDIAVLDPNVLSRDVP